VTARGYVLQDREVLVLGRGAGAEGGDTAVDEDAEIAALRSSPWVLGDRLNGQHAVLA